MRWKTDIKVCIARPRSFRNALHVAILKLTDLICFHHPLKILGVYRDSPIAWTSQQMILQLRQVSHPPFARPYYYLDAVQQKQSQLPVS